MNVIIKCEYKNVRVKIGGLTDNHTCEQLLCAQQPVLFLWMLLHVSPGPVALPRTRKTHHQHHLEGGERREIKSNKEAGCTALFIS